MIAHLSYGEGRIPVEFPTGQTTVIEPLHLTGLVDERAAVQEALEGPVASAPLRNRVDARTTVCILFTDITRATPNHRLIPWLLEYLDGAGVRPENITLLNALGTHRANSRPELERMLTPNVVRNYRVLNHDCEDTAACVPLGTTYDGTPALINKHCVGADLRIVTGFIEPHFFAGFSGGPKGIMPGAAALQTVMSNHGARNLGDANATFGITQGNPLWEELRDIALRAGPSFLLNVALNQEREITGVFAGDLVLAHRMGCEFVRRSAMRKLPTPFDIVITTNSGYPLDLNLYQGVKGMSAGARILKPGGTLILACECREGVPPGSSYEKLLRSAESPEELLAKLANGPAQHEQWQAQIQALVQRKARVLLHSSLPEHAVRAAHLAPCPDIAAEVRNALRTLPPTARVAVLPQGPLTIPYVE